MQIYLAEFEQLWDDQAHLRGQIDPNVLSAGGFPQLLASLTELLAAEKGLPSAEEQSAFSAEVWLMTEQEKAQLLVSALRNGEQVGPFPGSFTRRTYYYLLAILSQLENEFAAQPFVSYKVDWERSLGFALAALLEEQRQLPSTIWIDLHARSGLVAQTPLAQLLRGASKKQFKASQKLLREGQQELTQESLNFSFPGKLYPHLTVQRKTGQAQLRLSADRLFQLEGLYYIADTIPEHFDQYAYLLEFFDPQGFDQQNPSHQRMLWSSLLNAKAAWFMALKEMGEGSLLLPTVLNSGSSLTPKQREQLSQTGVPGPTQPRVVSKPGHWCSTGGEGVQIRGFTQLPAELPQGQLMQPHIPSLLFEKDGQPLHGHCRCLSVLSKMGAAVHLGFMFKLSLPDKQNSSAYLSYLLYYDERGSFLYGYAHHDHSVRFTKLESAGLRPLLSESEFQLFPREVRLSWSVGIRSLNGWIEQQAATSMSVLVRSGSLDSRYGKFL